MARSKAWDDFRTPNSLLKDAVVCSALSIASLVFFWILAPLDPDPHHDGYQYAVALAVSQGLIPHIDVFSQYGPVTAELQGALLAWGDPSVLTLRYFTAVLLALVATTAYMIARIIGLSRYLAAVVTATWVALCPAAGVYADSLQLWPWSAVVFTLVAQLAVIALLIAVRSTNSPIAWAATGFLLGSALWIRVNQGAPLIITLLAVICLLPETRIRIRQYALALIGGFTTAIAGAATYLVIRSDPWLYIQDAVIGPINRFIVEDFDGTDRVLAPIDVPEIVTQSYVLAAMPLLLIGTITFIALRNVSIAAKWRTVIVVVAGLLSGVIASLGYFGRPRDALLGQSVVAQAVGPLNALGAAPLYLAWLLVLVFSGVFLVSSIAQRKSSFRPAVAIVLFASLGFASQVVPRWDVYHLWWAGPLLLVAVTAITVTVLSSQKTELLVSATLLPFAALALYSAWNVVTTPRVEISGGAFRDMRILPERAPAARALQDLAEVIPARSTWVLCSDGIASAPGVEYASDRSNFVPWGWSQAPNPRTEPHYIVVCGDEPSDFVRASTLIPAGYRVIEFNAPMSLSPWSQTRFQVYAQTH